MRSVQEGEWNWVPREITTARKKGRYSVSITRRDLKKWILTSNAVGEMATPESQPKTERGVSTQKPALALKLVRPLTDDLQCTPLGGPASEQFVLRGELYTAVEDLGMALRSAAGRPKHAELAKQFIALDFLTQVSYLELADCLGADVTKALFEKEAGELLKNYHWEEATTLLQIHDAIQGCCIIEQLKRAKRNIGAAIKAHGYLQFREDEGLQASFIDVAEYLAHAMKSVTGFKQRGSIGIVSADDMIQFATGEMGRERAHFEALYDGEPNSMMLLGWCLLYTECAEYVRASEGRQFEKKLWDDWATTAALASAMYVAAYTNETKLGNYSTDGPFRVDESGAMRRQAMQAVNRAVSQGVRLSDFVARRIKCAQGEEEYCLGLRSPRDSHDLPAPYP
jgi:hypothetical protein